MFHEQAKAILDDISLCWLSGMELWEVLDRYERFDKYRNAIRKAAVKRYDYLELQLEEQD